MHNEVKYLLLDHFQLANFTVAGHDLRAIIGSFRDWRNNSGDDAPTDLQKFAWICILITFTDVE